MDAVGLCASDVDAPILVIVDLLPTATPRLDTRDCPEYPRIYAMVSGRFIETVSRCNGRNRRNCNNQHSTSNDRP